MIYQRGGSWRTRVSCALQQQLRKKQIPPRQAAEERSLAVGMTIRAVVSLG